MNRNFFLYMKFKIYTFILFIVVLIVYYYYHSSFDYSIACLRYVRAYVNLTVLSTEHKKTNKSNKKRIENATKKIIQTCIRNI